MTRLTGFQSRKHSQENIAPLYQFCVKTLPLGVGLQSPKRSLVAHALRHGAGFTLKLAMFPEAESFLLIAPPARHVKHTRVAPFASQFNAPDETPGVTTGGFSRFSASTSILATSRWVCRHLHSLAGSGTGTPKNPCRGSWKCPSLNFGARKWRERIPMWNTYRVSVLKGNLLEEHPKITQASVCYIYLILWHIISILRCKST